MTHPFDRLERLCAALKAQGADAVAARIYKSESAEVGLRNGSPEHFTQAMSETLSLRALKGKRAAALSSSDTSEPPEKLAERAAEMLKHLPEDEFADLADAELAPPASQDVDASFADSADIPLETLVKRAGEAESSALSVKNIAKSESAEAYAARDKVYSMRSDGWTGAYEKTSYGVSVCVISNGADGGMERDYSYMSKAFDADMGAPEEVGKEAARRTLRRINAKKPKSGSYDIIFEPRIAASLLGQFLDAVNGASVARKATFLHDAMNKRIFGENISIFHDPLRQAGLQSRPFDSECIAARKIALAEDGYLRDWLLNVRAAKRLGLTPNGCSAGVGSPVPAAANAYIAAGKYDPKDMLASVKSGIVITDSFGGGVNAVTGDFSRGASGLLVENGEIIGAVNEFTLGGNLKDMFLRMKTGNDLTFDYGRNSPTVMIDAMAVAGA